MMLYRDRVDKMSVDKFWMYHSTKYINGVENFHEYAFKHSINKDMKINYLCVGCSNKYCWIEDKF